ncbi:MAG TPA: nucleotide exchange factor GrpE [Rhodanobacteraceae bacterium]|nr:nucleotide exchange factor GrpE [Rhodanobacteraceae bacterium]
MHESSPDTPQGAPQEPVDAPDEARQELDSLTGQLAAAEATIAQLRDTMLREHAEVENQRRRMQRDLEQARRFANEKLLRELLPVCDNLERGLASDHPGEGALREGMQLTLKSLLKVMSDHGLVRVDPQDEAFDPEHHEAMSMVQSDRHEPNSVVEVLEKGYILNGRLLRPARVIVARDG